MKSRFLQTTFFLSKYAKTHRFAYRFSKIFWGPNAPRPPSWGGRTLPRPLRLGAPALRASAPRYSGLRPSIVHQPPVTGGAHCHFLRGGPKFDATPLSLGPRLGYLKRKLYIFMNMTVLKGSVFHSSRYPL